MRPFSRFLVFEHRRHRRFTASVALCAYLVTATGLPVPVAAGKTDGVPFPCQHHACGCTSAQQCWSHCCCFTPAERLAWAHENHVEPPAELVAEVAATHEHADCKASERRSCCAKHGHDEHDDDHEHEAPGVTLVIGLRAMQCRGLTTLWSASGAALPVVPAITWQFQWDVVEWLPAQTSLSPSGSLAPPIPPPRV